MTPGAVPIRVAYMMSRFPKLTETFVLDEMLELERSGIEVEIFPLWREKNADLVHSDARPLVERARFAPTLNTHIVVDNLRCLLQRPRRYLGTLAALIIANRHSPRFLLGAIAIFPKACSFAREMRRLGVRHVHAHFASHPAAAAFVIGRMADIPWSFTAHGSDLHREQSMLQEKVDEAAFVVTISEYNKRFILDRVGEDRAHKVQVVHCGVRPDQFERAQPGQGPLQIACVGTLHEVKGQDFLLQACARLRDRGIEFNCHFIGDGPDRKMLERRADTLGIRDRVIFHGACERGQVRALLARMDVVAAPSVPTSDGRREGIPVALIEAAACGLALVASRLSGIPELIADGETGYLAEPGDAESLADAISRLAASPGLRRQLGDAARHHLEREFNLTTNVARIRELIVPQVAA